jgi:hypothetical protein
VTISTSIDLDSSCAGSLGAVGVEGSGDITVDHADAQATRKPF